MPLARRQTVHTWNSSFTMPGVPFRLRERESINKIRVCRLQKDTGAYLQRQYLSAKGRPVCLGKPGKTNEALEKQRCSRMTQPFPVNSIATKAPKTYLESERIWEVTKYNILYCDMADNKQKKKGQLCASLNSLMWDQPTLDQCLNVETSVFIVTRTITGRSPHRI